jgi:hypothetical protein
MIYTHVLNKGGMGVKSPLDMTGNLSALPPVMSRQHIACGGDVYPNQHAAREIIQ